MKVPLQLLTSALDPENGREGWIYFNVVTKNLRICNDNDTWFDLTPPSDDPTPFYMHTHTYDGDVHTIDIQNKITFNETNVKGTPEEQLPIIVGISGGNPLDSNENASWQAMTLFDGGEINSVYPPEDEDTILEGGGSLDFNGDIIDGGGSI